jgi:hypothetical protein
MRLGGAGVFDEQTFTAVLLLNPADPCPGLVADFLDLRFGHYDIESIAPFSVHGRRCAIEIFDG